MLARIAASSLPLLSRRLPLADGAVASCACAIFSARWSTTVTPPQHPGDGWAVLPAGLAIAAGLALSTASCDSPAPSAGTPSSTATGSAQAPAEDAYAFPTDLRGVPKEIVLYQYEVCPFCCKVRAFLDYHKLPYRVVEVNPLTKAELKWSGRRKVPVVTFDGEAMSESSAIISRLAAELAAAQKPVPAPQHKGWFGSPKGAALPGAAAAAERERKWREWTDAVFVRVVTANIYRTWEESFQTFRYITDQTKWWWGTREAARLTGGALMWRIGQRMPKKYNIEGDVREALYRCCNEFLDAVGEGPFLGGAAPDLGDLAVFGVLRAVWGTDTFNDVMCATKLGQWYARMVTTVGPSARVATE